MRACDIFSVEARIFFPLVRHNNLQHPLDDKSAGSGYEIDVTIGYCRIEWRSDPNEKHLD